MEVYSLSDYEVVLKEEQAYLNKVITFLKEHIDMGAEVVQEQKKNLVALRKEMWAEGVPAADDYDRNIELTQYHNMERIETSRYEQKLAHVEKYKRVVDKPYFGRFDFQEEGEDKEAIYIGYQNVMNDSDYEVMVYDWRAPIASMFYRNELGPASYVAPCGEIRGEMGLKRQYEIERGKLNYFFDCSLTITDQMLKEALGHNASTTMKNIVETIQKEQDQIIRNKGNDVLIVQGVAGSGKTSIAMHRIAYLLYERVAEGLKSENIMIISPNHLFGEYVSTVLPELGEDNVKYSTMEDFFEAHFKERIRMRSRSSQLEYMITSKHRSAVRRTIAFKGSSLFVTLLDRLIKAYEKELILFKDVYYAGEILDLGKNLKKDFLDNAINSAVGKRLERIEIRLEKKMREKEKEKRKAFTKELQSQGIYDLEERVNETLNTYRQQTLETIRSFTRVDCFKLYEKLFKDGNLFRRLSQDLELPKATESMRSFTAKSLRPDLVTYEDGMALLYLKLKLEGMRLYPHIKQLLIDEAQDYYPLQYRILAEIFKGAQYTILGDIGQTIEKSETEDLYDEVISCLEPKNALKLSLHKSYRSSYEISQFTARLREGESGAVAFERHEEVPLIVEHENEMQQLKWLEEQIKAY